MHGPADIARFFREVPAGGDIGRIVVAPTRANGRPAVAMLERTDDGKLVPHGIMVLEIAGSDIAALDAFIDPALVGVFGLMAQA